jgi:RNA polymerase-binding transcription factor DksA
VELPLQDSPGNGWVTAEWDPNGHLPAEPPARPNDEVPMKRIRRVRQQVRGAMRGGTQEWSQAVTGMLADHRYRIEGELNTVFGWLRENGHPENGDVMDWAAFGYDRELGSARVNHLSQMLRQIDQAIARHAQGRYGRCAHCSAEIPLARLRSLPFALSCRACQVTQERPSWGLRKAVA